ncbi:hypothetical protein [Chryseobacterium sp.]|uniref:hypothetical protein n=1 Tax=Chryseobacterium sp. TaxID=1871047 RepID=UPI00289E6682|nr:hypothetical protein [Chryseobacterium sp.]
MKTPEKIAIGIVAAIVAGGFAALSFRKKKQKSLKNFTAPDGNSYPENHIYQSFDGEYFKNGKKLNFKTPHNTEHDSEDFSKPLFEQIQKNYHNPISEVNYHQKGFRHK